MRKASGASDQKNCGEFDVNVRILISGEQFVIKHVTKDVGISEIKCKIEMGTGIPSQLQRLHYLDEGEMMGDQTLGVVGIVPGALIKMKLWNEWNSLIEAVAKNDTENIFALGVTPITKYKTAMSEYMTPQNKRIWLAERAFVALFVAAHRGHQSLCQKLISSGADVNGKTSSGRCPLHIAAVLGNEGVLCELVTGGADIELRDNDGNTALDLAKLNGHQNCHRQLIQFKWLKRSKDCGPPINHPLFAHQYFDSSLKTHLQGEQAQMYCQQILPRGEFGGTGLGAPRRKEILSVSNRYVSGELESAKKSGKKRLAISSYTENADNGETADLPKAVDNGIMDLQQLWQEDESKFGSNKSCLSGDLIDNVIAKKLQEQHEKGIRSLPYDLWLESRDNTELYQAVRDRGQLDVILKH